MLLRVLVVEDSEYDAQLVLHEIRRGGYEVDAERVETRLAMQEALACHLWDIILCDNALPQFSAIEAITVLKESALDIPLIIISGTIGEDAAVTALKAGAHDFFVKGNFARLIPAIQRELEDAKARHERRLAQEALQESERRFRALVESGMDEIVMFDAQLKPIYMSPSVLRASEFSWAEMVEAEPFSSVHLDDQPAARELYEWLLQHPAQYKAYQLRLRRKDGPARWTEGVAVNLLDDPSVKGIVLNYRDITERKKAEARIESQLEWLSALRTIDLVITSSFDLRVTMDVILQHIIRQLRVDAAAILSFNETSSELEFAAGHGFRGDSITRLRLGLGEDYGGRAALERRLIQIPDLSHAQPPLSKEEFLAGEDFVSFYAMPLIAKGMIKGVLEIFQRSLLIADLEWLDFFQTLAGRIAIAIDNANLFENLQRANTELERRVAERTRELNRTNAELERANRAKDEFLANMSHELRTPLNSILGLSESLLEQRRDPLSDHQQKSLHFIESSGRHLLELINDVLDLSKIEAGMFDYYPQVVDVDTLCRSSLAFVKEQAIRKSIGLTYEEEKAVSKIYADPRRLKQILVNLLTNAVKFTPNNGQVTLEVHADSEEDLIQFSVIDNGIGIAKEDLKQLFRPFVQVDSSLNRQFEGTGLGLSLVQKLTDLHGGSVHVESESGKGSRFTINLPWGKARVVQQEMIQQSDAPLTTEQAEKSMSPLGESSRRGTVLLAEDNVANIMTIGEYLETHGYTIVNAHDGLEAIEKAVETNPDIILMDIQMPTMDGLEAMRRLRDDPRFESTPIIALTALAMPGDRERCLQAGASEYMSKPVGLKKLLLAINKIYGQAR